MKERTTVTTTAKVPATPEAFAESAAALGGQSLTRAVKRNQRVMEMLLEGIDQQASLQRLFEDGGNVNWLLGHLAISRDDVLESLGAERLMDAGAAARYGYGSKPAADADPAPLESLVAALQRSQQRVLEEIEKLDGERLSHTDERGRRLLDRLEFALWHEAYHLGQLTLYRKRAGLASPIG